MAQSDRLYFRADDDLEEQVEDYQERYGFGNRSEATRNLVEVGLREQQSPIVWRFKDRVVEWINLLSISAVVVFLIGATTSIYRVEEGIIAAFAMLTMASVLLAGFEFARVIAGMNEVGVRARRALAMVVGRYE